MNFSAISVRALPEFIKLICVATAALILLIPGTCLSDESSKAEKDTEEVSSDSTDNTQTDDKENNRLDYPMSKTLCIGCIVYCSEEESCNYAI